MCSQGKIKGTTSHALHVHLGAVHTAANLVGTVGPTSFRTALKCEIKFFNMALEVVSRGHPSPFFTQSLPFFTQSLLLPDNLLGDNFSAYTGTLATENPITCRNYY